MPTVHTFEESSDSADDCIPCGPHSYKPNLWLSNLPKELADSFPEEGVIVLKFSRERKSVTTTKKDESGSVDLLIHAILELDGESSSEESDEEDGEDHNAALAKLLKAVVESKES